MHSERAVFAGRLGITSAQRVLFRNLVSNSSFHSLSTRDSGWSWAWNKIGKRKEATPWKPGSSAPCRTSGLLIPGCVSVR